MGSFAESIISYIGYENYNKLQNTKIGIAGAGGLGSNCAVHLVRTGVSNIKIVDFDIVEFKNLNRQHYFYDQVGMKKVLALKNNLLHINPDVNVDVDDRKIVPDNINEIFNGCDIVVEAFDKVEYKVLLIEKCLDMGKVVVSASGIAGWGKSDNIKIKKINSNLFIVGDLNTEISDKNPPLSPRVNIASAKQADIILELIWGDFDR